MAPNRPAGYVSRDLPRPADELVRHSRAEQAALYIRRLIFDRHLLAGSRVPQDEIAQALGMSRIPVREALIALEREGWVTIETHRGAFINALDARAVRDHYELYGLVYGFAVQRALARAPLGLGDRLASLEQEFAVGTDPAELGRVAFAFHSLVVDAAGSPRVKVVLRAVPGLVPGGFFSLVPDAIKVERRGLVAIVRAVCRNDADRAAAEYLRMMRQVGDRVVHLFERRGLFSPEPAATAAGGRADRTAG
jgi:DNA-binding GntR family transcriptional regulator